MEMCLYPAWVGTFFIDRQPGILKLALPSLFLQTGI